jgi:hypothetical protein
MPGRALLALATALAALVVQTAAAQPTRSFDTDGNGSFELTIADGNGDGWFEWPTGTTKLPGRLDFTSTDRIAFAGNVTIQTATGLTYAAGAQLVTLPGAPLQKLVITVNRGTITGFGLVDLTATGDVTLTSYSFVSLLGGTRIATPGTITVQSKTAGVDVAQLGPDDVAPGAFALLAGKALNLSAKGNAASFHMDNVRLGSRAVTIAAQSSSSTGPRFFLLSNAVVTTNPGRTGLVGGTIGNVTLAQQRGPIDIADGSIVDAGRNVVLKAQYGQSNVAVAGSTIVAKGGSGQIDTRNVVGAVTRDASSTIQGVVVGKPFIVVP